MTDKGRDSIDFANDGIWPLFRKLFFPTLVGMIFNSALTIIDGIFVGHGVGADGIAAVNIVAPIFFVVNRHRAAFRHWFVGSGEHTSGKR